MILQKEHREQLTISLLKSEEKIAEIMKKITNKKLDEWVHFHEVELFLEQKQKDLIIQSLIDNDIDF